VVVPVNGLGQPNGLRADAKNTNGGPGHNPSRTAVDRYGDVWVANRAMDIQGSVTKIANHPSGCVERNGTPGIQTSQDKNNDGRIDTNPAAGEFIVPTDFGDVKQYDECILFSTPVGKNETGRIKARGLAISRGLEATAGDVWVGIWNDNAVVKLDARNGQPVPVNEAGALSVSLPFGPYGLAVDSQQRLWVVSSALNPARLALINTDRRTGGLVRADLVPPSSLGPSGNYGIAIDRNDRVWLAGWSAGAKAFRYTHPQGTANAVGEWAVFDFSAATSPRGSKMRRARGIAADDQGFIWMSSDLNESDANATQLIGFNGDTGAIKRFNLPNGTTADFIDATDYTAGRATHQAIGVGLDMDGNIWVNNRSGNAIRVHRDTGEVLYTAQQPSGLYTYSDFTGYQLRNFTAPSGSYRHTFTGCSVDTLWRTLTWSADVPADTRLHAYVTASNDPNALQNPALRIGPFSTSPTDLRAANVPRSQYLRVEFVLESTDRQSTPKLKAFDVDYQCQVIIR
jgi:hypothetical protein